MTGINKLSQFDYHHTLSDTAGDALVMFTAPACGACRQFKQLIQQHADQFTTLSLFEVDAEQELALTREFDIFHFPAFFLYRDGRFHAPLQSCADLPAFRQAIHDTFSRPGQDEP